MKGGAAPSPPQGARGFPPKAARVFSPRRHSGMVRRTRAQTCNAHRRISRFRVRCGACHRAALCADPLASPRNDGRKFEITMTRFVASLFLALAGLVLFGQGAYIHAKALLAQVLLERAFSETIASAIVLAGSSGQALAFGPGHVELTPDAGERGVAVYSAHRDTHFRFLKDIAIGDEIDITRSDGTIFRY